MLRNNFCWFEDFTSFPTPKLIYFTHKLVTNLIKVLIKIWKNIIEGQSAGLIIFNDFKMLLDNHKFPNIEQIVQSSLIRQTNKFSSIMFKKESDECNLIWCRNSGIVEIKINDWYRSFDNLQLYSFFTRYPLSSRNRTHHE